MRRAPPKQKRFVPSLLVGAAAWWVLQHSGPVLRGPEINLISALAAGLLTFCGLAVLSDTLRFIGGFADWMRARRPTGLKGTAGLVKSLRELRHDLIYGKWGPYWGTFKGREIISDYASNALSIGPAGSGKGVGVVIPTILAIPESKTIIDFKGELACVLAKPLRKRGETVRIVNLGNMWPDILWPSDGYNFLSVIADNYTRPGGLLDVADDCHELSMQLYPDPKGGSGENRYFDVGGRTKISFAVQTCILIKGEEANAGDVALMLNRSKLLRHAQWAAGRLEMEDGSTAEMPLDGLPWVELHDAEDVANYFEYYRNLADEVADLLAVEDSRSAEAFLKVAQQALAPFNIATRAHKVTSSSTFRFADQKQGRKPTTVFIVVDASKINAQKHALGLMQWCMFQELKRHPDKQRPVYLIADEATNYKLHDLGSLLTWGRGYGLRIHLIFQAISAFVEVYGPEALATVLSETEIKQFLAGQRDPQTLSLIEKMLAEESVVVQNNRGNIGGERFGVDGYDFREDGRSLMTADEIRRTDKTILIIRSNKPILRDLPSIAEIHPWRKMIDVNPFHGKPFLRPIKLRINRRKRKGPS